MSDGRIKWVEERCDTTFSDTGHPLISRGTVQDITDRILAQQALKESEERLSRVLDAVNDGVWDWNPETHELYMSHRWKEILGYQDHELENNDSSFFNLIHPEDRELVAESIRLHLEEKAPYGFEIRMKHKAGTYLWILCRGEAIRDRNGKPQRMLGTITDVTESKAADVALRDSMHRLDFLMSSSPAIIFTADPNPPFRVTFVSENVEALLGYSTRQIMGTDFWRSKLHPEDRPRLQANASDLETKGFAAMNTA